MAEPLRTDNQSTGQKSPHGTSRLVPSQSCVSIKQSDSPARQQFQVSHCISHKGGCVCHRSDTTHPLIQSQRMRYRSFQRDGRSTTCVACVRDPERPQHLRSSAGHRALRLGLWSHCIFRRCAASLPTSLSCISSVDQRRQAEETGCGDTVRAQGSVWGHHSHNCKRRHSFAFFTSQKDSETCWTVVVLSLPQQVSQAFHWSQSETQKIEIEIHTPATSQQATAAS